MSDHDSDDLPEVPPELYDRLLTEIVAIASQPVADVAPPSDSVPDDPVDLTSRRVKPDPFRHRRALLGLVAAAAVALVAIVATSRTSDPSVATEPDRTTVPVEVASTLDELTEAELCQVWADALRDAGLDVAAVAPPEGLRAVRLDRVAELADEFDRRSPEPEAERIGTLARNAAIEVRGGTVDSAAAARTRLVEALEVTDIGC